MKYEGVIFIVYRSTPEGNEALWRVYPHQLDNIDLKKYSLVKSHSDTIDNDELHFMKLPTSVKLPNKAIPRSSNGWDYSKIPKQEIKAIRDAYESMDYIQLDKYRSLYEIAPRCPVCKNLDNFNYGVFRYYFDNVV